VVAGAILGKPVMARWQSPPLQEETTDNSFWIGKGIVENLLASLSIPLASVMFRLDPNTPAGFHPAQSCLITSGSPAVELGNLGIIHPAVAEAYGLPTNVCAFELAVEPLRQSIRAHQFAEIPTTPVVQRDLTADVPESVSHAQGSTFISSAVAEMTGAGPGTTLLRNIELVSVFALSADKKSLSYRLTFQRHLTTLTAEEVDEVMKAVRDKLQLELSASFRL
jgi:phenylalanyl-tRNA synthetase beta chain